MKAYLLLGAVALGLSLNGAFYYVSPDGNDKMPGTDPAKPMKTLRRALRKAVAGDTVMLKGGLYKETIWREWSEKNHKPITIKAFPDETPVITFGWSVKNWKKLPGGIFVTDYPYAVCELWQRITLDRYLKVESMELLKKQPGAFFQDYDGKLYVNPFNGSWHDDPEKAGFTAIPYGSGHSPHSFRNRAARVRQSGLSVVGDNLIIDGLCFEFHSATGFSMRGRKKDNFYGSAKIRNCSAVGTTLGFSCNWVVADTVIENCRAIRNSGGGIQLGNYIKNIKLINNFLLNNGSCMPFYGNYTACSGHVFNLSRYGGGEAEFVDFIGNKVISFDKTRRGGVMRCKGGIRKHTNMLNNLFVGGGVSLYSVPGSNATIRNNSIIPGKFHFTVPTSGKKYTPVMKDNLEAANNWQKSARFVNPAKYDYRLLPNSPDLGKGYAPEAAPVWFVKPVRKGGSGRTPDKPLASLVQLQEKIKSGDTVYFMPGNYTGKLVLKNLDNILLSDMTFNKAKFNDVQVILTNCRNVKVENMDFTGVRFTVSGSDVEFKESYFSKNSFNAVKGKLIFANSWLENTGISSSGRIVLRENIIDKVTVSAKDVVSEHNGFVDANEFKKWPFKETFKSFAAGVNGKVPLKNRLNGTRGTWIGGRVIPDKLPPVEVEYLKVKPLDCGTKVVISWKTPKDYVRAYIEIYEGKKWFTSCRKELGDYHSTAGEVCIPGLKKGRNYTVKVLLRRNNESKGWTGKETFSTPEKAVKKAPRIIHAGKGTKYPSIVAAVQAAGKGDTVFIAPGQYSEIINIYVDDLTIKAKPGTVKLSGEEMFDYCLRATEVNNLTLDGLDFNGLRYSSKTRAVEILNSRGTKILNCRFFSRPGGRVSNVQLFGDRVKGFEVRNCIFNAGFHGLWLMKAADVIVDHNTFWGIGINSIHIGGAPGAKVVITNNLSQDVVSNHNSPVTSIGDPATRYICDWNLYWKTKKCPGQKIFGVGGKIGTNAVWKVMNDDMTDTLEATRKRFKIEKNGLVADPKLKDPVNGDFSLAPDSPARKRGSDGKDIGADLSVFAAE